MAAEIVQQSDDISGNMVMLQQLQQLQQLAQSHSSTDPATADAHLSKLRQAAAALKQCKQQHMLAVTAEDSSPEFQACSTAVGCLQALSTSLLQPPTDLYSGLAGAPSPPPEGVELAGEQHQLVAAAQLQLLALLLGLFERLDAPQQTGDQQQAAAAAAADEDRSRRKPRYFQGIVEIEELPADDSSSKLSAQQQLLQQLQQQLVQVLLVAALHAPDSSSSSSLLSPTCTSAAAIQAGHPAECSNSTQDPTSDPETLSCFCDSIFQQGLQLNSPWSGPDCQQQAQQLVQQFVSTVSIPPNSKSSSNGANLKGMKESRSDRDDLQSQQAAAEVSTAGYSDRQQQQQQQQQQLLLLLCHILPLLLDQLRDTLLAQHRHRKLQDKGDMVAYSGPSTFHRCLAARQLAWLVQQLQPPALTDPHTLGLLLPLILAVADDPSPTVRQYGHAALGWLGMTANSSSSSSSGSSSEGLQWQGALLRSEAKRLVVGCEETCWGTAMPAATSIIMALEGKDQRSTVYHSLMLELLQEAERTAHKPQPRLIFMACVARLVPRLGLYVVRHLAALMPLLLEWTHAYDERSSVVALQLLMLLVQHAWPRMGVHAEVLRKYVAELLRQERVEQGGRQGGLSQQQQQQRQQGDGLQGSGIVSSRRYMAGQQLLDRL